jgi:hypothetical protein
MSHLKTKIDVIFEPFYLQGKDRAIRQMVIQGADSREIDRGCEQLHARISFFNNIAEKNSARGKSKCGARIYTGFSGKPQGLTVGPGTGPPPSARLSLIGLTHRLQVFIITDSPFILQTAAPAVDNHIPTR